MNIHGKEVEMICDEAHLSIDKETYFHCRGLIALHNGFGSFQKHPQSLFMNAEKQLLFIRDIIVESRFGKIELVGYILERGSMKSFLLNKLCRGLNDLLSSLLVKFGAFFPCHSDASSLSRTT